MEAVLRNEPHEAGSRDNIPISSEARVGWRSGGRLVITQALAQTKKPQNPRRNPRFLSRTFNSQEEINRNKYVA
jgi:hypothetical protein